MTWRKREIMDMAREAGIGWAESLGGMPKFLEDFAKLVREDALAQPEQEPVAHLWQHGETGRTRVIFPDSITDCDASWFCVGPLVLKNTTQPQRTWVGLTPDECSDLYEAHHDKYGLPKQGSPDGLDYERAIEAKLRSKNEHRG